MVTLFHATHGEGGLVHALVYIVVFLLLVWAIVMIVRSISGR
jgi:hypothetical protein